MTTNADPRVMTIKAQLEALGREQGMRLDAIDLFLDFTCPWRPKRIPAPKVSQLIREAFAGFAVTDDLIAYVEAELEKVAD